MFCKNIQLLCSKNFLLRKRNKIRMGFEVLTPIIMFLLLMQLRKLGDKKAIHDCHFKPKPMPTAGLFPFIQGVYCSLNNTCEESVFNGTFTVYEESLLGAFEGALRSFYDWNKYHHQRFKRRLPEKNSTANRFVDNYITALENYLIYPKKSILRDNLDITAEQITCQDDRFMFNNTSPNHLLNNVKKLLNSSFKPEWSEVLKLFDYALCGKNVPPVAAQLSSILGDVNGPWTKRKEELESYSSSLKTARGEPLPYENDTSEFCNALMREIEVDADSRIVWKLVKPLIRGKIVYTPSAPIVNELMKRVGDYFSSPKTLVKNFASFFDRSRAFILQNRSTEIFQMINNSIGNILSQYFGNNMFNEDEMKSLFESNFNRIYNLLEPYKNVNLSDYAECVDWDRLVAVDDRDEAVESALKFLESERLLIMVDFVNVEANASKLPHSVVYKLRTGIDRVHATFQIRDRVYRPRVRRDPVLDLKDITQGFAYMQNLIEAEIIKELTGRKSLPGIYLKQTPYPCHLKDSFRESITRTLPMFMMISWIFLFSILVKKIVYEKERKIKQTFSVIGVTCLEQWLAWFLDAFVPMVFLSLILSIILVFGQIIPESNVFIIWLFLATFTLPTIALAFLISTLFSKSSLGAACAGLAFIILYMPYPPLSQFEESLHPNIKVLVCVISNIAFGFGCTWLANMEELGVGAQWETIDYSPIPGNPVKMTLLLGFFILDASIYFLLALYIEKVLPGGDSIGEPFYFFIFPSYWFPISNPKKITVCNDSSNRVGILIQNVTKKFGSKTILNQLNVSFYENEVTSFLGPNGAGKSTTISIMSGIVAPTAGQVFINDKSLRNAKPGSLLLGLCPQENILFDELTIEEHLYLYSRLKGVSDSEASTEVNRFIKDLKVSSHRHKEARHLSGGTQRKLSIAIAFVGGSRAVILDEPTAGVDPSSRRAIWDLIVSYKSGRTIVLTTHFLDEAELLGDKIVILVKGEVVCSGSPIYLKKTLGKGYILILETNFSELSRDMSKAREITEAIQKLVGNVTLIEQRGSEIYIQLPRISNISAFTNLFKELENIKHNLGIRSYGISDSSLEDIFLRLVREKEAVEEQSVMHSIISSRKQFSFNFFDFPCHLSLEELSDERSGEQSPSCANHSCEKCESFRNLESAERSFSTIFIKRTLHYYRNFRALLVQTLIPACFVVITVYLAGLLPDIRIMPPLEIDISVYSPSEIFYSMDFPDHFVLKSYEKSLLGAEGFGTKCIRNPIGCLNKTISVNVMRQNTVDGSLKKCPCLKGTYLCEEIPPKPPGTLISSGDTLLNMTGRNISNWIIKTELTESYKRYGGITLGLPNAFTGINVFELLNIFDFPNFFVKTIAQEAEVDWKNPKELVKQLFSSCSPEKLKEVYKNVDIYDNIMVWFNNRGWISALSMLNGISNIILRSSLPETEDPSEYSITLINHPLPVSKRQFEDTVEKRSNITLLRSLSVVVALAFVPAMYCLYIIEERENGFKHLLLLSGVRRYSYWLISLIWDYIFFLTTITVIVIVFVAFQEVTFIGKSSIGVFLLVLLSYAFVSIALVYPASFCFRVPSFGFVVVASLNVLIGVFTLLTTFVLDLITEEADPYYLATIFLLFPQFCVGRALLNMAKLGIRVEALRELGVTDFPQYASWDVAMKYVVCMIVEGIIFFGITLIIEYGLCVTSREKSYNELDREVEDDVIAEQHRVLSGKSEEDGDILIVKNLTKRYNSEQRPAVNKVSFGVPKGECFGLLGLNGAGKSTIFKMLTGILKPTSGTIQILGTIASSSKSLPLGYCPQVNPIDGYLTPIEHLSVFGRLRGLTGVCLKAMVLKNIKKLSLESHCYKLSSTLSGGNKRKLTTAIAICGKAPILLLDEPTTGMDPNSRRLVWKTIQQCIYEGQCVVLTSHSMEECQTLCTKLTIVVNGKMQCFGSSQHLKNKYDKGYSVLIRAASLSKLNNIRDYMENRLPGSFLEECHYLQMKYILKPGSDLAEVFLFMNQAENENLLRDYCVTQTSLEQIFLSFAKHQQDDHLQNSDSTLFCCKYCFGRWLLFYGDSRRANENSGIHQSQSGLRERAHEEELEPLSENENITVVPKIQSATAVNV